ncbi:hypothetical protein H5410_030123 [Solanum commersonii]|uniref:Uncharacterized protein n=1 Tax=Solanum commersonii TaxID=4109 RepID=A0A9J5YER2_SOLCO|nr:hypothetical protein H5410_030123 [Solanum commersonii]
MWLTLSVLIVVNYPVLSVMSRGMRDWSVRIFSVWEDQITKGCPKCKCYVEKSDGCLQLTCWWSSLSLIEPDEAFDCHNSIKVHRISSSQHYKVQLLLNTTRPTIHTNKKEIN